MALFRSGTVRHAAAPSPDRSGPVSHSQPAISGSLAMLTAIGPFNNC
jgi:hypothetical protein